MGCNQSQPQSEEGLQRTTKEEASTSNNLRTPVGSGKLISEGSMILKLMILEAQSLIPVDLVGSSDPFCIITFASCSYKTKVVKRNLNPVWDQKLAISLDPATQEKAGIAFSVHDRDHLSSSDLIGNVTLEDVSRFFGGNVHDLWLDLNLVRNGTHVNAGKIHITLQIQPFQEIERMFWKHFLSEFDVDHSGDLTKQQLGLLFEGF